MLKYGYESFKTEILCIFFLNAIKKAQNHLMYLSIMTYARKPHIFLGVLTYIAKIVAYDLSYYAKASSKQMYTK